LGVRTFRGWHQTLVQVVDLLWEWKLNSTRFAPNDFILF